MNNQEKVTGYSPIINTFWRIQDIGPVAKIALGEMLSNALFFHIHASSVGKRIGRTQNSMTAIMKELQVNGYIVRDGEGYGTTWDLTDKALKYQYNHATKRKINVATDKEPEQTKKKST